MMRIPLSRWSLLALCLLARVASAQEVLIYTGTTQWIDKAPADVQAQICVDKLTAFGITNTWYQSDLDMEAVADWVAGVTGNGQVDVLVLYGDLPPTIYPDANAQPDDSPAEAFIESTDGDVIINHADYMFWGLNARNSEGGLQNMMDIPGIVMWDDNTPVVVTDDGRAIAPSLTDFQTDRPFHLDQLAGEWAVEKILAQNEAGTRADPVIVRDGDRGRLIPVYQTAFGDEPKGAVAAEIIAYIYGKQLGGPTKLALSGPNALWVNTPGRLVVQLQEDTGSPANTAAARTINLSKSGATGAFDVSPSGAFDGSITSVTVAAGTNTAEFYFRDSAPGTQTITVASAGLTSASHSLKVFAESKAPAGEVTIYTGTTQWIAKDLADAQAQICSDKLTAAGITNTWFSLDSDMQSVADWVSASTGNGKLDVLVLYGDLPPTIYPDANTQPDGSVCEAFLETEDGDAIINHADYMFWGLNARNQTGGLENIMDIPGIVMWDDNTPMVVTDAGREIAPSLTDFLSDRPFHVDQLAGDWLVERSLAESAAGNRADPIIVRDGSRGRLIPCFQAADQNDPKGAVAFEIIAWLMGVSLGGPSDIVLTGGGATVTGRASPVTIHLQDDSGSPRPAVTPTTINLSSSAATGRFDTSGAGAFDGTVTSVVIPAGESTATVYYKDTAEGAVTLTASSAGLVDGTLAINVYENVSVTKGEVVIYTGVTQWITKPLADEQAVICSDLLAAAGILSSVLTNEADTTALSDWMVTATGNGALDVLVIYGDIPPELYPQANAQPDDSIAELFIESTDGDVIINHADYMFWGFNARNQTGGLENMMDIPGIVMWDDNTPVTATAEGTAIAPSLPADLLSDRPFHLDQLAGDWFAEVILAQNAAGTRADPVIVRDGNRGRLIPVFQSADQNDPKGAVAAEIIQWLMTTQTGGGPTEPVFHRGDADSNGQLQLTDAVRILGVLFLGQGSISCLDAGDADDNGQLQLTDAVRILGVLFLGQGEIPAPGPTTSPCGVDPSDDGLGCESYTNC